MIPQRLIQLWLTPESSVATKNPPLKMLHRKCQRSLLQRHPDFEYRLFSNEDCVQFIKERRPGFLPLWHYYPRPVQRADFFRVLALYELGGFYFDLDIFFHEPIHELARHSLVFPAEWVMPADIYERRHREPARKRKDLHQVGNYAFGAAPKHWFLRELLEEMVRRTNEVDMQNLSDDDVLYTTGPDMVNAVARRFPHELASEMVVLRGEKKPRQPVPPKSWGKDEWFQFGKYGNHLMSSVWRKGN